MSAGTLAIRSFPRQTTFAPESANEAPNATKTMLGWLERCGGGGATSGAGAWSVVRQVPLRNVDFYCVFLQMWSSATNAKHPQTTIMPNIVYPASCGPQDARHDEFWRSSWTFGQGLTSSLSLGANLGGTSDYEPILFGYFIDYRDLLDAVDEAEALPIDDVAEVRSAALGAVDFACGFLEVSEAQISEALAVSRSTFHNWRHGRVPRASSVAKIFGLSNFLIALKGALGDAAAKSWLAGGDPPRRSLILQARLPEVRAQADTILFVEPPNPLILPSVDDEIARERSVRRPRLAAEGGTDVRVRRRAR